MIKIENTETYGWKAAIRGMRNPMNSWDKSDSLFHIEKFADQSKPGVMVYMGKDICGQADEAMRLPDDGFIIGDADFALMKKLAAAGTGHAKYLRMITVTTDIVAPLYWWKEMDTYKVGTTANSCSTMHKIHAKEFALEDFSHEHLIVASLNSLKRTIEDLNACREGYLSDYIAKDPEWRKEVWWQMIQLLPSSYNQRRTVQMNYAVLRNIYHARKSHKLDEWVNFCRWIEGLPYSKIITCETGKEG